MGPFVLWITGLSGAGKSTVASEVYKQLKLKQNDLVYLDGDLFRKIMGDDLGHDHAARLANAYRMSRFCSYLSKQSVSVVCATMSLFPEIWTWNRANIPGYFEVYLKVDRETLAGRDPQGLYQRASRGEEFNMVGVDLPFTEPNNPDLVLDNNHDDPQVTSKKIIEALNL